MADIETFIFKTGTYFLVFFVQCDKSFFFVRSFKLIKLDMKWQNFSLKSQILCTLQIAIDLRVFFCI